MVTDDDNKNRNRKIKRSIKRKCKKLKVHTLPTGWDPLLPISKFYGPR